MEKNTFVFCRFKYKLHYFKCTESVVPQNNHTLLESMGLTYYKVVFNSIIKFFKKNVKPRLYALEDFLGVDSTNFLCLTVSSLVA